MTRAILCALLVVLTPVTGADEVRAVRARYLITVADDFLVDVYHNGRYVPESQRTLILDRFGATVERIDVEVRDGDWLVFNVVNNRLRWGGACYFAVAGCHATNEFGFVSRLDGAAWSVCDEPSRADRFISERNYLRHRRVEAIPRPWHEGTPLMRQHAGTGWNGTPVWGARTNTWIKVLVGEGRAGARMPTARSPGDRTVSLVEGTSWSVQGGSGTPFVTFRPDGVVQGARPAIRGRWYPISDRVVVAEWKSQIYAIRFERHLRSAQLCRKGENLPLERTPSTRRPLERAEL